MRPNYKITKNFWFMEFFKSSEYPEEVDRMLDTLDRNQLLRASLRTSLFLLCKFILQPTRDTFGCKVIITSGYRDTHLNALVAKTAHSLHTDGIAADFTTEKPEQLSLVYSFIRNELADVYGQLILYKVNGQNRNIHVSLPALGHEQLTKIEEL